MTIETTAAKIKSAAISVTVVSFLLVIAIIIFPGFFKGRLDYDIFKLTYQFLLLTVIGGLVTFLFSFYIRLREEQARQKEQATAKRKEERSLQRRFYNEFTGAYNEGKKIRRFLRARTRKLSTSNQHQEIILLKTERYDELLKELTILQLKFEFFYDEVSSNPELFAAGDVKSLAENLKKMEEYLNQMVGEYEQCYTLYPNQYFLEEVPFIALENFDKLKEFIGRYKDATGFRHQFKKAADKVSGLLVGVLTSPASY
jgi:hypothetical protein